MSIEQKIISQFGLAKGVIVPDDFIERNDNIMWLKGEVDYLIYVPSYMLWCVRHKESDGNLVCDHTISSIAEFGRCKDPNISHLNFKFLCNAQQKSVVSAFLSWALENLESCNEGQINRSLKHW